MPGDFPFSIGKRTASTAGFKTSGRPTQPVNSENPIQQARKRLDRTGASRRPLNPINGSQLGIMGYFFNAAVSSHRETESTLEGQPENRIVPPESKPALTQESLNDLLSKPPFGGLRMPLRGQIAPRTNLSGFTVHVSLLKTFELDPGVLVGATLIMDDGVHIRVPNEQNRLTHEMIPNSLFNGLTRDKTFLSCFETNVSSGPTAKDRGAVRFKNVEGDVRMINVARMLSALGYPATLPAGVVYIAHPRMDYHGVTIQGVVFRGDMTHCRLPAPALCSGADLRQCRNVEKTAGRASLNNGNVTLSDEQHELLHHITRSPSFGSGSLARTQSSSSMSFHRSPPSASPPARVPTGPEDDTASTESDTTLVSTP